MVSCRALQSNTREIHFHPTKHKRGCADMAQQIGEVGRGPGGWKGSPNSIATLRRYQIPWTQQRPCKRCSARGRYQIAVRDHDQCWRHLGRWSPLSSAHGRGESRLLARLERAGLLPFELIALPLWRNLNKVARKERAPLRLAMVRAWDKRYQAPLYWAQVQREALELGARPAEKRWCPVDWYENQ